MADTVLSLLFEDIHSSLAAAIDAVVSDHGVPGSKESPAAVAAWQEFPRSSPSFRMQTERLSRVAGSLDFQQGAIGLLLRLMPPSGDLEAGEVPFGFQSLLSRLNCVESCLGGVPTGRKAAALQARGEGRLAELVFTVVPLAVADILACILGERPEGSTDRIPLPPSSEAALLQLAFRGLCSSGGQQQLHPSLHEALARRAVLSWREVIRHLSTSSFETACAELNKQLHADSSADEAMAYLVGCQHISLPKDPCSPMVQPFFQLLARLAAQSRRPFNTAAFRRCLLWNLEGAVQQVRGQVEGDASMLQTWVALYLDCLEQGSELAGLALPAAALLVSRGPAAMWFCHMDVGKESKKVAKGLLGGKKVGLLRLCLTDLAYEERTSRPALCAVLRLLAGGAQLPASAVAPATDGEWWRAPTPDEEAGQMPLMTSRMPHESDESTAAMNERLRFVAEKLFWRKSTGRHVRLPKLLENGDVVVLIVGQIAVHSPTVAMDTVERLLAEGRDAEYQLLGVCALRRLLSYSLLSGQLEAQAARLLSIIGACEAAVGAEKRGLALAPLAPAEPEHPDAVKRLLRSAGSRKDREVALRLATYREAVACVPLVLPPQCLQDRSFFGQLLIHSDHDLATATSVALQQLMADAAWRRTAVLCTAKLLERAVEAPGGSRALLCSKEHHGVALQGVEAQLLTLALHLKKGLHLWAASIASEPWPLESLQEEAEGTAVARLAKRLAEADAAAASLLLHPSVALRAEGLALLEAIAALHSAHEEAYRRALAGRLAAVESATRKHRAAGDNREAEAGQREEDELRGRIDRQEASEPFLIHILDRCEASVVRRAIRRDLTEAAHGVLTKVPSQASIDQMQIPPLRKLLMLPPASLGIGSQFMFVVAEIASSLLRQGCTLRAARLRSILAAALGKMPASKDLAAFVADGSADLGVLWRNHYAALFALCGACKPMQVAAVEKKPAPPPPPPAQSPPLHTPSPFFPPPPPLLGGAAQPAPKIVPPPAILGAPPPALGAPPVLSPPPTLGAPPPPPRLGAPTPALGTPTLLSMPDLGGGGGGADADDNPVQQKAATAQGLVGWDAYSPRSVEHLPPPLRSGASRLAPPPLASDASDDAGDVVPPPPVLFPGGGGRMDLPPPPLLGGLAAGPPSPPPSPPAQPPPSTRGFLNSFLGGGSRRESTDSGLHTVDACPPHEAAVVEAYNVTKPLADRLWPVLADKDLADGWTGLSVALLASCLDSDGASMGVESLSAWWTGLSRRRDDLRLSMARTLRSITQTEGFGRAVLSDAARSEHQRLLKLCLGFVRESKRVLEDPSCVSNYPLCLEVVQLVASLAAATAGDVRYDPKRWLRPLMVPASLQNSWPIVERCSLLELLMRWVRWREDKALAALATGGVRPQTQRSTPAVGSLEEQALFRIETVSAHAILLLVQSGPVMERDRLLAIAEAGPWSRDLDLLGWYESTHAEEGHNTLACLLGHHFEHLLPAFLHRAYFFAGSSPRLSTRYFHAIVDALVPADAALDDGPAAASDRDFESEVEAASPSLMLFGMIHLASTDARTRSRAFDLICRLTDSFGPAEGFECDGSSLGARRLLYAADEPTPMLLSSHLEKMRLAVAAQCPALSLPLVRGGVALLTQTQPLALTGAQQLLVLRTLSPWLANLQLEPLPSSRLSESSTFQFLREIAIVGLQPWSASGEAGDAYGALWHQLSARPADRSTAGQPAAPSNAYVIASFMLQVASRSDKAATLVRRLAVIAFDASPAELLPMLLARIEGEPLEESPPPTTQPCAPGPGGLIESVGSAVQHVWRRLSTSASAQSAASPAPPPHAPPVGPAPPPPPPPPPLLSAKPPPLLSAGLPPMLSAGQPGGWDDQSPAAPGPPLDAPSEVVEGASGADQAEDPIMAAVAALSGKPSRVQPRTLRFASAAAATEAESAPAVPGGLPEENEAVPAPEEEEGEEELLASTEQLRAAALLMLIEPLRHSMQRPLAQSAVCGEMPRILNLALLLMHSQSESALSVEENRSLRQLLQAMLESIVEAHRQSAGLAHLPVGVTTNQLPREVLALTERLGLASFRLRWPRVPNEVNNATPSIAMAMEAVNCCPIKEALCGILACVEGLGRTEVAAEWFSLAINRLRQPMELADRFKELSLVRLLLPLQPEHVRVTGLFHLVLESAQTALLELEGAAAARQRKSLPLALAEEAGALLGDIAARLAARGQLVQQPLLPWALVALTASPHPSIHATVYPALCFCLDHEPLLVAMRAGTLLPPPPRADSGGGDAFAGGLLAALLRNVCAAGCWGGAAASGLPVAHNGPAVAEAARGAALQSLRLASSVQAALVLSSPKREVAEMLAGVAAPLLDCWVIQLCELHALLSGASADTFATRAAALAAFEGLSDAAVAVDSLRGDTGPTTTTAALVAVASGDFALGDGDAAIRSLATPLLKAFLPTAGPHLARFARRLLASGPKHYAAPVLLLCTVALRTPGADCVAAFKPIVQGVAGLSLPAVPDLLLAAAMAGTRPTRLEAVITTAQCEGRDTALAAGAADTGAETRGASGALHALEQVLARA